MRFDYQLPQARSKIHFFFTRGKLVIFFIILACITFYLYPKPEIPVINETIEVESKLDITKHKLSVISNMASLNLRKILPRKKNINQENIQAVLANNTTNEVWKDYKVLRGDSLSKIFKKMHVAHNVLDEMIRTASKHVQYLKSIHPGQTLNFLFDDLGELKELKFNLSSTQTLHIRKVDGSTFKMYCEEKPLVKKIAFSSGIIQGSLFQSAHNAGLDDKIIMQMVEIFSWDIDFNLDIRNGDKFQILFEENYLDQEKIDSGNILAVEFHNQGKVFKAIQFAHEERVGYYSPEGFSLQKAFLRTPVKFSRISSHFSPARKHPLLHKIRAHNGVDYAAPSGTPVRATGDGKIIFMGNKGGYGRSIEINHGQKYSTFYAHLSKFHPAIKNGAHVKQGAIIGYVGRSGLATGDHLHYEFKINGVHRNPLTVKLPKSLPVSEKYKNEFILHSKNLLALLNSYTIEKITQS